MAKKARPASPRPSNSGGGDSNTGLIVTLVFFVLATLTLGVFTYFGYDGQIKLAEDAKKAKAESAKASKERDEERTRRLVYAIAAGADQTGDQQALNQLKAGNKAAFDQAVASLKEVKWDAALDRPGETLIDLFGKLRKDTDTARAAQRTAEAGFAEAQKPLTATARHSTTSSPKPAMTCVTRRTKRSRTFRPKRNRTSTVSPHSTRTSARSWPISGPAEPTTRRPPSANRAPCRHDQGQGRANRRPRRQDRPTELAGSGRAQGPDSPRRP